MDSSCGPRHGLIEMFEGNSIKIRLQQISQPQLAAVLSLPGEIDRYAWYLMVYVVRRFGLRSYVALLAAAPPRLPVHWILYYTRYSRPNFLNIETIYNM
jgi:hypothetical protein